MTPFETFLRIMLWLHIAGGAVSLITGLGAMLTAKGSRRHRTFGKIYFGGMTAVFVGAVVLAVSHELTFLLMVGFFSYYLTVRGYRILYLKDLSKGQRPNYIDWIITGISAVFILFLFFWGAYALIQGEFMGIVGLVFGLVGSSYLFQDLKNFLASHRRRCIGGMDTLPAWEEVTLLLQQHSLLLTFISVSSTSSCG